MHFCCLFLKLLKVFSVSLILLLHTGHANFDLIDFQYLQNVAFSFGKDSDYLINSPQQNIPFLYPLTCGEFSPYPLTLFGKPFSLPWDHFRWNFAY